MSDFAPIQRAGATQKITVSSSSQALTLNSDGAFTRQYRVCNLGTATVWINFGPAGTVAAATTDIPIPGNGFTEVWTSGETGVAAIAAAATGDIAFTPVDGI